MPKDNAIVPNKNSAVALAKDLKISVGELQTIQNTIAKGATVDELKLFLFQAKRTGLDPFSRQIHLVKRGDTAVIQTGIDGYRAIAERTGKYAGNDEPVFEMDQAGKKPIKASVTVWKIVAKQRVGFTASARWSEYFPGEKLGFMWNSKPFLMLSKCAEALALRKAFPSDLSGLYVQEEMQKVENLETIQDEKPPFREVVMTAMKFAETMLESKIPDLQKKMVEHNFTPEETKAVEDILCERGFCKEKETETPATTKDDVDLPDDEAPEDETTIEPVDDIIPEGDKPDFKKKK